MPSLGATAAPKTVNNFVSLANKGYFNCVRLLPGDPLASCSRPATRRRPLADGNPGYTIPDELPAKAANAAQQYPLGALVMANTGQPNTGGSQFFIVSGPQGEGLPNSLLPLRPGHVRHERDRHD